MPGSALPRRGGISSTIRSANGSPPSAEGGKGDFVPAGTTKGRSPSGDFAIALWKPSPPTGAIVGWSRRLCQPPRPQPPRRKPRPTRRGSLSERRVNPNPSRSSGERGLGGEGLLSEKPPLPPESPPSSPTSFPRGSAREGAFHRKASSLAKPLFTRKDDFCVED